MSTVDVNGNYTRYTGAGVNANDALFTTGDTGRYNSFQLMSTTGAVQVLVSLDGTTFATAPLSLVDQGATTSTPVLLTVAARAYQFLGKFAAIKVTQNGATASAASLNCWKS